MQNFIDFTFISDEAAILSCHPMMSKLMGEPEGSTRYRNKKLSVGECFIQGWCNSLMNAHKYLVSMQEDPNASFFGIYDGYGGDAVARYSSKYLHKLVVQQPEYKNNDFEKALKQAFLNIDEKMKHKRYVVEQGRAGSTALVILIKNDMLYCANAGNCRAIASVCGEAVVLTAEPKMTEDSPRLYRTLGDFELKRKHNDNPMEVQITAYPNVESMVIDKNLEFIVMASKGIWSAMSDMNVLHFCRTRIARGIHPQIISDDLMIQCFANESNASKWHENLTVAIICFLHGKPYRELVIHCRSGTSM